MDGANMNAQVALTSPGSIGKWELSFLHSFLTFLLPSFLPPIFLPPSSFVPSIHPLSYNTVASITAMSTSLTSIPLPLHTTSISSLLRCWRVSLELAQDLLHPSRRRRTGCWWVNYNNEHTISLTQCCTSMLVLCLNLIYIPLCDCYPANS